MKKTNITAILICLFMSLAGSNLQAQRTQTYGEFHMMNIGGYRIVVLYDATFEGFATQLRIKNTRLYIESGPSSFENAAENRGLKKVKIPMSYGLSEFGYPIDKFTIYMEGTAVLSEGQYTKYFYAPFKVQLSRTLGDFTTPEFSQEAKNYYKDKKDVWEKYGSIRDSDTKVTEMYLQDFDIRVKK